MKVAGELFLLLNTALTAFSLFLSARIMRRKTGVRLFVAAALSTLYALLALQSKSPLLLSVPATALCVFLSTLLAFKKENAYNRFRLWAYALGAGMLLSGLGGFFYNHGFPAFLSVGLTMLLTGLACLLLQPPPVHPAHVTQIEIGMGGQLRRVSAMLDSGNLLVDPITAFPVIMVSHEALKPLLPPAFDFSDTLPPGFRMINVHTAAGRGRMPIFTPDSLRLESGGQWQAIHGVIAVAPKHYKGIHALVPVSVFEGGK